MRYKDSRDALEVFIKLNMQLIDLKKFQLANAEAIRKILKKYEKRTALTLPVAEQDRILPLLSSIGLVAMPSDPNASRPPSLSRVLVVLMTESLLPITPFIDDYLCLICTSIAFKPIRPDCRHLFCVRCLAKMQKRGQAECPLCRAQTVLTADRTNVDYAVWNFMMDWFPKEAKKKLKANEAEAASEELEAMGFDTQSECVVM
ncbi:hypothetical protein BOTBODRAFT_487385 [Botryobasidium botryosum FD-172 SS1]|uniref:RING-type domain-containing protein n=1 Tax=Botryobasidium botryosum (strain FD-172 SS1) TaxID=930990 RepID=A0A067M527_BOTB1|nr:hypothetical protein BOTBODRAFT_487385 [Botryobasidium botryosum FD-172 SS1]